MDIVEQQSTSLARPLNVLIPLIKQDLEEAKEAGKPHYRLAGEKLHEAKLSGGMTVKQLTEWSERHFKVKRAQTLLYMQYADATSHLSAQDPHPSLHRHRVDHGHRQNVYPQTWHKPVKEAINKVDVSALKQEALARQAERALQRKLALHLIDIGFKALATKLHPDKGGSPEAMTRLNRVRKILQEAVSS